MLLQIKAQVPESLNGERFDVAASELCKPLSRKKIKMIIDRGGAYLNKKRILMAKKNVSRGDVIELFWDDARPLTTQVVHTIPVSIIAEFSDFIVINKPAGLPSQATLTSSDDTVIHALKVQYKEKFSTTELCLVHRLDKETSGVMLIAKSKSAQTRLEKLFLERKVSKKYRALCYGIPTAKEGVLNWPIRKDSTRANTYIAVMKSSTSAAAQKASKDVKSALTHFKVMQIFSQYQVSDIECRPVTGRTHQIRVHLQALGVPLLGDKTYSQTIVGHPCAQWATRHMLHAQSISWVGEDGQTVAFEAPFPDDFADCLKRLQPVNQEGSPHEL
jgi:RluA family pseudouridine synthase